MPPRLRTPLFLALLTIAAAVPRFLSLGHPTLWGDEALVYWRTCGSYADLLAVLHEDGFPPLHYELYWAIVHTVAPIPGPAAMRVVPAIAGTLMVPAVYFLARQLVTRRASQLAAVFTAGSAFALFYSRDAKMYAEAWAATTVAVGCLLWWLRTGRTSAWLAWVAVGAIAAGMQSLTLVAVVGLSPLLLLTGRRTHWRQALAWLGGVVLIAAGPAGYYGGFNGWSAKVDAQGWQGSGLSWINVYNRGRTGPDQVGYLTTTFLTGWEWPRADATATMPAGRVRLLKAASVLAIACLAAGALPWPVRRRSGDVPDVAAEPPWRAALWLAAWVVLPAYGFYARSVPGFAAPVDWIGAIGHPWTWAAIGVIAAVAAVAYRPTRSTATRWLSVVAVLVVIGCACQAMAGVMRPMAAAATAAGRAWQSVWVPRYLGFAWPAVAVVAGAMLARLPTAAARWSAVGVVLAVNLGLFAFRLAGSTEPPVDRMAADVWAAQPRDGRPSDTVTYTAVANHPLWQTGPAEGTLFGDVGRYYLQQLARRPAMTPDGFKRSLSTFTLPNGNDLFGRAKPSAIDDDVPELVAANPAARHVVVWEQSAVDRPAEVDDELLPQLPGWHRSGDETVVVRDVWTGRDVARYRRRSYDR